MRNVKTTLEKTESGVTLKMEFSKTTLSNPWTVAEYIAKMDKNDPHYVLKLANIIKGYTHGVKADENDAAIWRTDGFKNPEEFKEFFERRANGHGGSADAWFTSKSDSLRLRHFYHNGTKPKECTSEGPECLCWKSEDYAN